MGAVAALVAIAVLVFRQLEDSPRESEVGSGHRVYEPV
jgi:hypothetical protein